jgi:HlyD family secretion protein
MGKKTKWVLIIAAVLIVLAIILLKAGVFKKEKGERVIVETATTRTIIETVNATGKVYPEVEVKVTPDISGEITELTVQEGDTVKKGQLLARIYADIYSIQKEQASAGVNQSEAVADNSRAALDALKAQLDQAQRNFDMQKQLYNDKVISLSEFNVADASLKTARANYDAASKGLKGNDAAIRSARANLSRANKDLGRTQITAPMDGVVSLLNVKKGERVAGNSFNIGTEILRIANMNMIEVRVDVGESDIPKVKLADTALVTIDAYSDRKFKGIVTQIASSNNGASLQNGLSAAGSDVTQYKVYIRLLPESYMDLIGKGSFPFKPGMSASADIQTRKLVNILSVPINAVTTREKDGIVKQTTSEATAETSKETVSQDELDVVVFVVGKDNRVKKVGVKTGIQDTYYLQVTEGLKPGEVVVSGPYDVVNNILKDSTLIRIVDKKDLYYEKK